MVNAETLIAEIIAEKRGNKELALFYLPDVCAFQWRAEIGCPSSDVLLGEASGEYRADAPSLIGALQRLLENVRNGVTND